MNLCVAAILTVGSSGGGADFWVGGPAFTDRGGVTIRVRRFLGTTPCAHLRFEVQDIGISAKDKARLFQPFIQANR